MAVLAQDFHGSVCDSWTVAEVETADIFAMFREAGNRSIINPTTVTETENLKEVTQTENL